MKNFGDDAYKDGRLDRKYLSAIVFKDAFQLELLNSLVHPYAIAAAEVWAGRQRSPYVVKEAALFFEAGSATGIDYMVGVYAPQSLRLKRAMDRDKLSREAVLSRMDRQLQENIKMRLCDFVIRNDDSELLIPQVLQLHERFLAQSKEKVHA
jgi:dephospho-CoA kinase